MWSFFFSETFHINYNHLVEPTSRIWDHYSTFEKLTIFVEFPLLLTAAIEAHEKRHVACFDIPGAFLHAKCEDGDVYMKLEGKLAELMTLVEPKLYRQHV